VVVRAVLAALVVAASGVYSRDLASHRAAAAAIPDLASLPREFDDWVSEDFPLTESVSRVLGADATLQRRYVDRTGKEVWLFLAYFAQQAVNSQIHSPRHCLPGSGWTIVSLGREPLPVEGRPATVAHLRIRHQEDEQDMYYWFRTRGGTLTGEYALKWDLVKNSLLGRPTDAVFVRYSAPVEDRRALGSVVDRLDAPLTRILGGTGL
jgi:EpsI family protein